MNLEQNEQKEPRGHNKIATGSKSACACDANRANEFAPFGARGAS